MKKLTLLLFFLTSTLTFAQQEVKIDILDALALKTIEASYEHYINEDSSVGLSLLFNFEKRTADFRYNEDQMITPYFRHYFSARKVWNTYGELFIGYNKGKKKTEVPLIGSDKIETKYENYTDGALGVAIGAKYLSKSGFLVDVYGGLGRNLFNKISPTIVPRVGVNIGYRF